LKDKISFCFVQIFVKVVVM